jgi:methylenetetrahydrofolate dehydrogenase (NADP+)/methenyltetrahydrofolate cyclohydrolase
MYQEIDGKRIAEKIKDKIAAEIFSFDELRPNLAIILVGEREDSKIYVSLKESEGKKVGIDTHIYRLEEETSERDLLDIIEFLNRDLLIDGILVQLPLPKHINTDKIILALDPKKDVDGFHPQHPDYILSPVLGSVKACLKEIKFEAKGRTACVLYNSEIFGGGVKELLEKDGLKIIEKSKEADVLVTALGNPHKIKSDDIKQDAVVIDIGITKVGEEVLGDVDFESVKDKAKYLTPVPGGIGPITVAFLFKNVLEIFKRHYKLGK